MKAEKRPEYLAPKARLYGIPPGVNYLSTFSIAGDIEELDRGDLLDDDGWGGFEPLP